MPAKGAEDSFRSTTVLAVYALPARLTGILCSSVIAFLFKSSVCGSFIRFVGIYGVHYWTHSLGVISDVDSFRGRV